MKIDKKRRNLVIWLTNILMATVVVAIVWFLVFVTQGWTVDSSGETQQAGLVQFASIPSGATIEINEKTLPDRSNSKTLLLPGDYNFKMWREGYETWFKSAKVREGEILWLNYARLVPKNRKVDNFLSIKNLKSVLPTPNRQRALAISEDDDGVPKVSVIDFRSDEPKIKELDLGFLFDDKKNQSGDPSDSKGIVRNIDIVKISSSNSRALLRVANGDVTKWLRIDFDNSNENVNITDIFHLNFSKVAPVSDDMSRFVVEDNNDLRIVDLSARTISEIFLSGVVDFNVFNNEMVGIVKKQNSNHEIGLWKVGEKAVQKVAETEDNVRPNITMARYYNENYIHVAAGKKLTIYKGKSWNGDDRPKKIRTIDLDFEIEKIKTNLEGRFIILSNNQQVFVWDIERREEHRLEFSSIKNSVPAMIDNFIFYDFKDGKLVIRDFDGKNEQALMNAESNLPAILSPNGKYIFGFSKKQDGFYQVSRLTMVI